VATFLQNLVYSNPGSTTLAGGIQSLSLPYVPNDTNRTPLAAPTTRGYSGIRQVFAYSEYLWSTVWARPLVLNSARPNYLSALNGTGITFRYSNPLSGWPKASNIYPDSSAFDLTATGGGVFNGVAPVGLSGAAAPATGTGRFFWTAFTPSYQGDANSGAAIARTWLADDATKQIPSIAAITPAGGDATVALGFMTPQDATIDKRARDANGAIIAGQNLGGYRVLWFNPTKDASGDPVAPDFWVVELTSGTTVRHFMLPSSYPQGAQHVADQILTDARTYLPSGRLASAGPAITNGVVTDAVAPGYCWFDVDPELRPSGLATLRVFAVKSVLRAPKVAEARRLNRPDWMDAIKTATATMKMVTSSGADLTYAFKIPFNYDWDVVVVSGPATTL
jgi:hypothetical protein